MPKYVILSLFELFFIINVMFKLALTNVFFTIIGIIMAIGYFATLYLWNNNQFTINPFKNIMPFIILVIIRFLTYASIGLNNLTLIIGCISLVMINYLFRSNIK